MTFSERVATSSRNLSRIAAERPVSTPTNTSQASATIEHRQPEADELELTVLGDWYGESLCVHMGDGEWAIVDSFKRTKHDRPAALEYLDLLGVSPSQVRTLLITHWDADHIDGVSDIARECPNAHVFVTAAMDPELFSAVIEGSSEEDQRARNALTELCKIIDVLDAREPVDDLNELGLAERNLALHESPMGNVLLCALTPTRTTTRRGLTAFGNFVREAKAGRYVGVPRRIGMGSHENNHCSVAAMVHAPATGILLGADLEHVPPAEGSPELHGWDAAASGSRIPRGLAALVKVPHHGSDTGYCESLWGVGSMLIKHPAPAILAPWRHGNRGPIPTDVMAARLHEVTDSLWAASTRRTVNVKTSNAKIVRRRPDDYDEPLEARPYGHVTARFKPGPDQKWIMTTGGNGAFWNGTGWQRPTSGD